MIFRSIRTKRRRCTGTLRIVLAAMFLVLGFYYGPERVCAEELQLGDLQADITFGINGNYRYGAGIPVMIRLMSETDFEGAVRVVVPQRNGGSSVGYEKEIILSAGSPKKMTMTLYSEAIFSYAGIELLDEKGTVIDRQELQTQTAVSNRPLVGILSKDYPALVYFDGLQIEMKDGIMDSTIVTELTADTLPDSQRGLEALSFLVINSYDTASLAEAQQKAVMEWVEAGGVLILGLGPDGRQTRSMIGEDILSIKEGEAQEGSLAVYGNAIAGKEYGKADEIHPITVAGAWPVPLILEEDDMVWSLPYGQGNIVVTSFNLGMEPIDSWPFKSGFAARLLSNTPSETAKDRIYQINEGDYDSYSYILNHIFRGRQPNQPLLIGMLVFFALLLPVTYLILKKIGKSQLLWLVIPGESILMAAVILLTTATLRLKDPIITSVTCFDNDVPYGKTWMQITCPDIRKNRISFTDKVERLCVSPEYGYGYTSSDRIEDGDDCRYRIRENASGYEVVINSSTNFEESNYNFRTPKENNGNLTGEIHRSLAGISGTVTNNTGRDLREVYAYTNNSIMMLGDLAAGETVSFEEGDVRPFYYFYDMEFFSIDRDDVLYVAVSNLYEMSYYALLQNRQDNEELVMLIGIETEGDMDFIENTTALENNLLVYRSVLTAGYEDYPNAEVIDLFNCAAENITGDWDWNDGQMYSLNAETSFYLDPGMKIYAISKAQTGSSFYGSVENTTIFAYNFRSGSYEELFPGNRGVVIFDEECPYVEDGILRMRFTCSAEYEDYVPKITVIGGKKDAGN